MTSFACWRLRPALVDLAEGALAPGDVRNVEAHVAVCASCRDDLAAMRGLASELADTSLPPPPEDFWLQQRQAIMRKVRVVEHPAPVRATSRRWQLAGALATIALAVVATRGVFLSRMHVMSHNVERLDDDALFHLHDLLPAIAPASTIEDADGDMLAVHDLGDDELDSLDELLNGSS
jgi:anti-sigma factor RsiW